MKSKFLLIAFSLFAFTSCKDENKSIQDTWTNNQETSTETENVPTTTVEPTAAATGAMMEFESREHDFGTIIQGEKVTHVFKFLNSGTADLIISEATGTCGCTVPDYPKTPVKPGDSAEIKVSFDSTGKSGMQQKSVNITANTPNGKEQLNIRVNIKPKA